MQIRKPKQAYILFASQAYVEKSSVYNYSLYNNFTITEKMGLCYPNIQKRIRETNAIPLNNMEKGQMKHPHCVKRCPIAVDLEADKEYFYCSCGLSKNQPFCDGSHQSTIFKPVKFKPNYKRCYLCLCKRTKNPPYCDNTHKLSKEFDF